MFIIFYYGCRSQTLKTKTKKKKKKQPNSFLNICNMVIEKLNFFWRENGQHILNSIKCIFF